MDLDKFLANQNIESHDKNPSEFEIMDEEGEVVKIGGGPEEVKILSALRTVFEGRYAQVV